MDVHPELIGAEVDVDGRGGEIVAVYEAGGLIWFLVVEPDGKLFRTNAEVAIVKHWGHLVDEPDDEEGS